MSETGAYVWRLLRPITQISDSARFATLSCGHVIDAEDGGPPPVMGEERECEDCLRLCVRRPRR